MKRFRLFAAVGGVFVLGVLATSPANAFAASPPNDNRANARPLGSLPAAVTGTTAEASQEARDPYACRSYSESVWYRLESPTQRAVSVILDAKDDLDAVVAVYRQQRSQLPLVACRATDRRGRPVSPSGQKDATYFILVAQQPQSDPGSFQLEVFAPEPPARPPGARLPDDGVRSTVDPLRDADDAWSVVIPAGRTFRINLVPAGGKCISLSVYRPHDRVLGGQPDPPARVWGICRIRQAPTAAGDTPCSFARLPRAEALSDIASRRPRPDLTTPLRDWRCATARRTEEGCLRGHSTPSIFTDSPWRDEATSRLQCTGSRARFDLTVLRDDGSRVACECGETGAVSSTAPEPGALLRRGPSPGLHGRALQAVPSPARSRLPC